MKTLIIKDGPNIKTSALMAGLKKKVDVYSYWDDAELDKLFPPPSNKTERAFAMSDEPTEKNMSYTELQAKHGNSLMTLREYIMYFLAYYAETGKCPDAVGWTIFGDPLLPDGYVARGDWLPDRRRASFGWGYADGRYSGSGGRVAISPSSLNLVPSAMEAMDINAAIERVKQEGYVIFKQI